MQLSIVVGGERHSLRVPTAGNASCPLDVACACGARPIMLVRDGQPRPSDDDRAYEADGHCSACRRWIGTLRLETGTLFGVREDEAVLNGRPRVY